MQYKEIALTRKQLGHLLGKQITRKKKKKREKRSEKEREKRKKETNINKIIEIFLFSSFCPLPNSCFVFIVITALEFFYVTFFCVIFPTPAFSLLPDYSLHWQYYHCVCILSVWLSWPRVLQVPPCTCLSR